VSQLFQNVWLLVGQKTIFYFRPNGALEMTYGCNLRNLITNKVFKANKKTESLMYHSLCAHASSPHLSEHRTWFQAFCWYINCRHKIIMRCEWVLPTLPPPCMATVFPLSVPMSKNVIAASIARTTPRPTNHGFDKY